VNAFCSASPLFFLPDSACPLSTRCSIHSLFSDHGLLDGSGAPGGSRTPDLLVRSQTLYPAELRAPTATASVYDASGICRNRQPRRFILSVPNFVLTQPLNGRKDGTFGGVDITG
jgi:hypothetical protein